MNHEVTLAQHIRILRETKGYSQEYLASQLDITQQTYSNIEKNPEKTTIKRLKEIAEVLQVSLVSLLGEDGTFTPQNFSENGANFSTQTNKVADKSEYDIYERLITELKEEIAFLRELAKESKSV